MKIKTPTISITVFLCALAYASMVRAETLPPIIISEIQISENSTKDEFVELYNTSDNPVNLKDWELRKKTKGNTSPRGELFHKFISVDCKNPSASALTDTIPANGHILWTNKDGSASFTNLFDVQSDNQESPSLAENNGLALFDDKKNLVDGITWDICPLDNSTGCFPKNNAFPLPSINLEKGTSKWNGIVRNIISNTWDISTSPTPENTGKKECPVVEDQTPPQTTFSTIRLNELFPNPSAKNDAGEFIELYNFGTEPVNISDWTLRDASKTGKYIFPANAVVAASAYFVVTDQDFKLSLNNSNETVTLFDTTDTPIDSVHYEKTKEDVSLNYTPLGWRGGTPTPGTLNQINNLPETQEKVPKKGFKGTPVIFNAKGKDADGDALKYVWDFGDGHKSYKEKTSHKYEENGVYTITLTTTDGSDDVIETFTLKIEPYPHPKIRITSLMPNPAGKDTDNEWVMLENRGKKTINLKGFGIATGWKNLVNHPIREDFIIKSGQEIKLTRAHSLFILPNQKGKVELRAPDRKALQKIKYKLEKSAAENATYQKKKGRRWNLEETAEEPANTNTEITPPSSSEEENPIEEPAPAPDINTLPEEENEESPDSQETEGAVLGASVIAETNPADTLPQKQEYSLVSLLRQAFSNINAYLNNMWSASQN